MIAMTYLIWSFDKDIFTHLLECYIGSHTFAYKTFPGMQDTLTTLYKTFFMDGSLCGGSWKNFSVLAPLTHTMAEWVETRDLTLGNFDSHLSKIKVMAVL